MAKVATVQTNFNSGELSPLLHGRIDQDRYKTGCAVCLNYIPMIQGPLTRRSGSYYVAETKFSGARKVRLKAFTVSTSSAFMIEFGHLYVRFFKNEAVVGVPYEVVTPYTESEVFDLKFTQSADVLYITHPSHPPMQLNHFADTNWTLTQFANFDGPYLDQNTTPTTFSFSAGTGVSTLTASSTTGINNNTGFQASDVGRFFRGFVSGAVYWGTITAYTSPTVVTTLIQFGSAGAATPITAWRLGLWCVINGYPSCVMFHEDRLCFSGVPAFPQRVDCSGSSFYTSFSPTLTDGTVVDSSALAFSINSNEVNAGRWITSDEKGMLVGSSGGEWAVKPAMVQAALTPTDITAKKSTSHGSANVQPVQIGKATMFVERAGRKIRELAYFYDVDGYRATDVTKLSEHITQGGVVQMAYQREPQPIVWCVRADGVLLAMGYEREQDTLVVSWSRHIFGNGGPPALGIQAQVESVDVIPSADGTSDTLWVVVKREIGGAAVRYVEFLTPTFTDAIAQEDAFFVDAGLTYDQPKTVTNITDTLPITVTSTAHGFSNGDQVRFSGVVGFSDADPINPVSGVNDLQFTVAAATANTFQIAATVQNAPYISGGKVRKLVTVISGLDHLNGMNVQILADGAVGKTTGATDTVSGGQITLDNPAAVVQVGLGYNSDVQTLRTDAGAADGTAMGKTRRINRYGLLLHDSLGLKIGASFDKLQPINFRKTSDNLTRASSLAGRIFSETIDMDYDFDNTVCIRQDQPLPSVILAVFPQFETQDR
jgi:hypothetical protein